jgi:hypothetical protein
MTVSRSLAAVVPFVWLFASPLAGQSLRPGEVFSSIAVTTLAEPRPVLGADNRIHLAYEYLVTNPGTTFVTLDRIEAVTAEGRVDGSVAGAGLVAMMKGGESGRLPVNGLGFVLMDVSYPAGTTLPRTLAPRITLTRQLVGPDGKPAAYPPTEPVPATVTFTGPARTLGTTPAVVIAPPLRGSGWVAVNGCCDAVTSHRGAIMSINGVTLVPERFAIDWIKLDAQGRAFTGAMTTLAGYPGFGSPVHAVADGTVVNLYDAAAEQVPGTPRGITTENIGGNMIVVDIGGGNFAFFAHLQPGSLKVRLGDKVKTGQVIALLGNTGNTTAPHLHFHVMDGPSPLDANSLPYVFTRFTGTGRVRDTSWDDAFAKGAPVTMTAALTGAHEKQLPLNNQVVDFGK